MTQNPYEVSDAELIAAGMAPPAASFRFTWLRVSAAAGLATIFAILANTVILLTLEDTIQSFASLVQHALGGQGPPIESWQGTFAISIAFFVPPILLAVAVFGVLVRVFCRRAAVTQ